MVRIMKKMIRIYICSNDDGKDNIHFRIMAMITNIANVLIPMMMILMMAI